MSKHSPIAKFMIPYEIWGRLRAFAPSLLSQGFVVRVYWCDFVNTRRCCALGHWGPGPIKWMAGCEAMKCKKCICDFSPDGTLVFLHARGQLAASLIRIDTGALRETSNIHDVVMSLCWKWVLRVYQCSLEIFVGLLVMMRSYGLKCRASRSDAPWI